MATYQAGRWDSVQLANFRRFEDTGPVDLAPITLLFGKNSSGKTSLLRAPLLIKQMFQESSFNEVPLAGPYADFGRYQDVIFNGLVSRDLVLRANLTFNERGRIAPSLTKDLPAQFTDLLRKVSIEVVLHWNKRNAKTQIQAIEFSDWDSGDTRIRLTRKGPSKYSVEFVGALRTSVDRPLSFAGLRYLDLAGDRGGPQAESLIAYDFLMYQLSVSIQSAALSLMHIGPLREMPDRAYRVDQRDQIETGAGVVEVLSKAADTRRAVSRSLAYMGMASEVSLLRHAPGYMGIGLTDVQTGRIHNLADVGFGVSQVLPILVSLATAPLNSTVLIEQPELHLHPDAQGQLADVLFDLSRSRQLTLVMETHSEHILLRLQRRVAEEVLSPDDVATYFVHEGQVRRAAIDELGSLESEFIPTGFFEDEWADAVQLAYAAARRKG